MARFDPRAKIGAGLSALSMILITLSPMILALESLVLLAALLFFRLAAPWGRNLGLVGPTTVLVFLITYLSFDLTEALWVSWRLLTLLTVSFVFFQTISSSEMGDGLTLMGFPRDWSFILTAALRYVPLTRQRARQIVDAQQSRGIDLRPRLGNVCNILALLGPLLIQSIVFADQLALAMESRGFTRPGRTQRRSYRMGGLDFSLLAVSLGLLAVLIWVERV